MLKLPPTKPVLCQLAATRPDCALQRARIGVGLCGPSIAQLSARADLYVRWMHRPPPIAIAVMPVVVVRS